MRVVIEIRTDIARIQLVQFDYPGPRNAHFQQDHCFWLDMCLTPRRPNDTACYADRWVSHRCAPLGSVALLPPGEKLALTSGGGRRTSLICQIDVPAVRKWLPPGFEMTDRRLEACFDISSPEIGRHMRRLAQELRLRTSGWRAVCSAVAEELAIDLGRHLASVTEADERGSLAAWRLRVIDRLADQPGHPPSLSDIAEACKLSVRQMTRAFRLTRGCSIGEFIAHRRIEAAKCRLATDESIKSIADGLGFSSQANFSTAFRRATGAPPYEFRTRVMRGGERRDS